MHGGIGMTDDVDIGLFMKRARVQLQQTHASTVSGGVCPMVTRL